MEIKTMDGGTQSVASNAAANTGITLGAVGLGLSLLQNGGLGGLLGGNNQQKYVTKDELEMSMKISEQNATIALLQSEKSTDAKLVDVFKASAAQDKELRGLITAAQMEQEKVNAAQSAWNATAGAQMATMANQIANQTAQLASITTYVVPNSKVCDTGCGCGCA